MTTTEFPVNLEAEGLGTLFITDARLLIRPAVPGQYHRDDKHDSAHAYQVLILGNDMGVYTTHIICQEGPREAQDMLNRVFRCYLDFCCMQLWCDARVNYIIDGETVTSAEHGFDDGSYTMFIHVYCSVAEDKVEDLLNTLTSDIDEQERFIVVRPDSSELGYVARGFTVDESPQDDLGDEPYDDEDEDEDPLAGDVDPTGGYYEPPINPFEAHRLEVMRQHGDYTG